MCSERRWPVAETNAGWKYLFHKACWRFFSASWLAAIESQRPSSLHCDDTLPKRHRNTISRLLRVHVLMSRNGAAAQPGEDAAVFAVDDVRRSWRAGLVLEAEDTSLTSSTRVCVELPFTARLSVWKQSDFTWASGVCAAAAECTL